MMSFHTQEREEAWVACHPERSEGSLDGQADASLGSA